MAVSGSKVSDLQAHGSLALLDKHWTFNDASIGIYGKFVLKAKKKSFELVVLPTLASQ